MVNTAQARRTGDGLLIEDRRLRRLTAVIVTIMLVTFATIILLTVLGTTLDGFVGTVPWAWIAGVGLWLLSAVLCEVYIHLTRQSVEAGGERDV
jgi:uncharacterized membrane protein (DUF485 family)